MPDSATLPECPRCGVCTSEPHVDTEDCIDALRDVIARLQFQAETSKPPVASSNRGGRRDRSDARMVVLDGERLCLTEAARRLGLSASALHFRLLRRTHDPNYGDVDVRALGADHLRALA